MNYTATEKRVIGEAFDEIAYCMGTMGHREPHRLRAALKIERRERSCLTAAKALLVNGFAEGMADDPPASTVAGYSEGIAVAVMLGADYGRRGCRQRRDTIERVTAAAKAAHDAYIRRALEAVRA